MRKSLPTNLRLVRLARLIGEPKYTALGLVNLFWSWVDEAAEDGLLPGYTAEDVDSELGFEGFAQAMIEVGWLEQRKEALFVPEFDKYLGKVHRKRAADAARQRKYRSKKPKTSA